MTFRAISTILGLLIVVPVACIVSTERLEGEQGPQGEPGAPGLPGDQPFGYSPNEGDIYYDQGNVIVGADALGPETFNFYPIIEVAGTRGTMSVRTTESNGIATIRLTGPGMDHVDDWHINASAGDQSIFGIYPIAKSDGPAFAITNVGNIGIGTSEPSSSLTIGQSIEGDNKPYGILVHRHGTLNSPGAYTPFAPALEIRDYSAVGPSELDPSALVYIAAPRIGDSDPGAKNAVLLEVVSDNGSALSVNASRSVGIGTRTPMATLDINGTARLAKNSSPPVTCDSAHDGTITLTSTHAICVCNGSQWVRGADGTPPCPWN